MSTIPTKEDSISSLPIEASSESPIGKPGKKLSSEPSIKEEGIFKFSKSSSEGSKVIVAGPSSGNKKKSLGGFNFEPSGEKGSLRKPITSVNLSAENPTVESFEQNSVLCPARPRVIMPTYFLLHINNASDADLKSCIESLVRKMDDYLKKMDDYDWLSYIPHNATVRLAFGFEHLNPLK